MKRVFLLLSVVMIGMMVGSVHAMIRKGPAREKKSAVEQPKSVSVEGPQCPRGDLSTHHADALENGNHEEAKRIFACMQQRTHAHDEQHSAGFTGPYYSRRDALVYSVGWAGVILGAGYFILKKTAEQAPQP